MQRVRRVLALALVALAAGALAGVARADTLDANDTTHSGSIPIGPLNQPGEQQTAQLFTAQGTGSIAHIDVLLWRWNATGSLQVQVTDGLGGPVVAQTTLPNAQIPTSPFYTWVSVTFPGTPVLQAGHTYALTLGLVNESPNNFASWGSDSNGPVQDAYYFYSFCGCFNPWALQNADYQVWLGPLPPPDSTPPTLSATHPINGQNGWNTNFPLETVTASDTGSGLSGKPVCIFDGTINAFLNVTGPGSWWFPAGGPGVHTIHCTATDNAGNTATADDTVKIDASAPSLSLSHPAGWNSNPATVSISASDVGASGLAGTPSCTVDGSPVALGGSGGSYSLSVSGDGTHAVSCTVSDVAGNSTSKQDSVQIDASPPSISVAHTADGLAGWNVTSPVAVSINASDSASGLAGAPSCTVDGSPVLVSGSGSSYSLSVSGEGSHAVSCTATDNAGNSASAGDSVDIDTAGPSVTYTGDAGTYGLTDTVSIHCAATDPSPGSGIASTSCANVSGPAWSFGAGSHTVSATATDVAGNVGNGTATFTVSVTVDGLCALTRAWSTNAGVANAACEQLGAGNNGSKRPNVAQYDKLVAAQAGKAFTAAQAATLQSLAAGLA